jgi:hypothetical protein
MLWFARRPGEVTWRATIMVGLGDDDAVGNVGSREFESPEAAQAWIERHLPAAEMPDWAADYPHNGGGVYLWGWVQAGFYSYGDEQPNESVDWEPDLNAASFEGDLVDGQVQWQSS